MMMMMMMATRTTMTTMMMMMAMIVMVTMTMMMMLITTNDANMWSQEGSQKGIHKCELSVNLFGVGRGVFTIWKLGSSVGRNH